MSSLINVLGLAMFMDFAYRYYIFSFVWWWITTVPFVVTLFLVTMVIVIAIPSCSHYRMTLFTTITCFRVAL
ncbi:hypothetical protein EB796_001898 [Bugula neritina]|uniref:Transmembrane protein n=1 Tax=Bugula neritina TaxID=10212 RepID=A0A7J7KNT1_BUGNE|nr:hypothetical protein EB796_001898 [Bugula neritina]